ncbi:MAG TPA: TIGR04283 family arsenosugar biosynthesis glycosyltransferase [Thermodesulfobacteriota bacterium]|nr:TIGR04283 family arsenosugar biosynthesis glycosyltransferase [Thermodesulfobacteriota bacterium]
MISVVVPTYNESTTIEDTLNKLLKILLPNDEVIIVDGESEDNTQEIVRTFPQVKLISSKRGRAIQMNVGAQKAKNQYLLFLHADNIISSDCLSMLRGEIRSNRHSWGWFPIRLNSSRLIFKILEAGANLRLRLTGTPLGDHGIFVKKEIFDKIGGFPEIPIMEDLEFVRKVKSITKGVQINCPIGTSVRRFEKSGILKTFLTMWVLRILYYSGISMEKLSRYYENLR